MASSRSSDAERIVGGFASLLSSALTLNEENELEPLKETSTTTLPKFISSLVSRDSPCCVIPTLMLKHNGSVSNSSASSLEEAAALNLARPLTLRKDELSAAPVALLGNLIDSFSNLIDSRLRSSIQALLRQTHRKDDTLKRVLVGLLACSDCPINPTTVVTSFRVLPAHEFTIHGDLVMPLVMETVVDLKIFGSLVTVNLVAPGTIQGSLKSVCDGLLHRVEVVLDTVAFLQSMMKQARHAVKKAVAMASSIAAKLLIPSAMPPQDHHHPIKVSSSSNFLDSSSFSSSRRSSGVTPSRDIASRSLMPPPPSRPSKRSLVKLMASSDSLSSRSNLQQQEQQRNESSPNATWSNPRDTKRDQQEQQQQQQRHEESRKRSRAAAAAATGLSLLTTAAICHDKSNGNQGIFNEPVRKRTKLGGPTPRRVTSCPSLDASS